MNNIEIGDLVERKYDGAFGIVIDSKPPNQGLESKHIQHMLTSYHDVYYVYFSGTGVEGPIHITDLKLSSQYLNYAENK